MPVYRRIGTVASRHPNAMLYDVLDQPENKEARRTLREPGGVDKLKAASHLPSGTVLSVPTFKALLDDKGESVRDAKCSPMCERLDRVVVMEKRAGWGRRSNPAEISNWDPEARPVWDGRKASS